MSFHQVRLHYFYFAHSSFYSLCLSILSPTTGCRLRNSRITSSRDSNCSSIIITTIISRIITKICLGQLDPSRRHVRSHQIRWHHCLSSRHWPTTLCIRIHSFSRLQMALTWTCTSHLEVRAECSMAWPVAIMAAVETIINSMAVTTLCSSHPENAPRSWISNRVSARFRLSNKHSSRILNRPCRRHRRRAHQI